MFRGLLHVRLKAADRAVSTGHLDDALRMTGEPDIKAHPKGIKLRAKLADALIERAREHYRADRFTEAFLALGKAERCGGDPSKIEELRRQVTTVADEVSRKETEQRQRIELARHRIHTGSLAAGRRILEAAPDGEEEFDRLKRELESREKRSAELLAKAQKCFDQAQFGMAIDRLVRAKKLDAHNESALKLEKKILDTILKHARAAFVEGKLRRMGDELDLIKPLHPADGESRDLSELLSLAKFAAEAVGVNDFDEARRLTQRLAGLAPQAKWIKSAAHLLVGLDENLLALRSGPLGDFEREKSPAQAGARDAQLQRNVPAQETTPVDAVRASAQALHLLVDGGGSYLILRNSRVTLGRAVSSNPADVAMFADIGDRHAELTRIEDDYFLISPHEVEIGGHRSRQQLLRDSDRIALARRAKFTFRIPNRRSSSARLDISDSSKMPNDVRCVILMKETVMMGRGGQCHITCQSANENLVLFERGGGLWIRCVGRRDPAIAVELGTPLEIAGVSFVVQPWMTRTI
ncbi:MAG: hypothetical protein GXP29_12625 [Planctomycetes bacterium]|nr:hypothetical protein [Planctomycetota bacterium]